MNVSHTIAADPKNNAPPTDRRSIIQFIAIFAALLGVYFAFTATQPYAELLLPYLRLNASVSAAILDFFSGDVSAVDNSIISPRFSVVIARGCDAIDPSAVFLAAVVAFPVSIRRKLPGMIVGTALLLVINLVRIVTLYYAGIYYPDAFETLHHDVWQGLFIMLALLFWMIWAGWAQRPRREPEPASA